MLFMLYSAEIPPAGGSFPQMRNPKYGENDTQTLIATEAHGKTRKDLLDLHQIERALPMIKA
jgi:hypothetical protein